jgi:hypothetical protein
VPPAPPARRGCPRKNNRRIRGRSRDGIQKVEVNIPIDDEMFRMPGKT